MRIFIISAVVMLSLLTFAKANACSCTRGDIWISEFLSDDFLIFEGVVLSTKPTPESSDLDEALRRASSRKEASRILSDYSAKRVYGDERITEFSIEKLYNGDYSNRVKIEHSNQSSACGFTPPLQKSLMVIAKKNDTGVYVTSSCWLRRAPAAAIQSYFETGQDIYLPNRRRCYDEIKEVIGSAKNTSEIILKTPTCNVYKVDIIASLQKLQ